MHLVDLAGSERAKRTGAEGTRLKARRFSIAPGYSLRLLPSALVW